MTGRISVRPVGFLEQNMSYTLSSREIPLLSNWDVIVVGGGVAGTAAAIAACREGSRTLLIEAHSCLGGLGSAGMVPGWCGPHDGVRFIHHSIFEEMRKKMAMMMGETDVDSIKCNPILHPEYLKLILDDMVEAASVETWFFTTLVDVEMRDDRNVDALIVNRKEGLAALKAPVYIDATGDGDLAARAGAECMKGDERGLMQPVTLCAAFGNIKNYETFWDSAPENWADKMRDDPEFPRLGGGFINFGNTVGIGTKVTNAGHLYEIDGTDTKDLTRGMVEGRRLATEMLKGFQKHLPDQYGQAHLVTTASLLGIRETRRVVGNYILQSADHEARRSFDDEIARNHFFLDVHHSREELEAIKSGKMTWAEKKKRVSLGDGESHGIPYRCLTPKDLDNVLTAGRNTSADRGANGAIRVMPPCTSMGEAAGIAAHLAAKSGDTNLHNVDVDTVRKRIREEGGYLP